MTGEELIEARVAQLSMELAAMRAMVAAVEPRIGAAEAKVQMLEVNQGGGDGVAALPAFGEAPIPQLGGDADGCYELAIRKDGSSYVGNFTNQYFRVGGKTYTTSFANTTIANGILCLTFEANGSQPDAEIETYADVAALNAAESDLSKFICPLYTIANHAIVCDWRKCGAVVMTEF